jgi:hypothetical protein
MLWCVITSALIVAREHTVPDIPYTSWRPLSVAQTVQLFTDAPFAWGLAGGYAVEQFVGKPIREHGDIDVIVFRDQQHLVQHWLERWQLYAADPPGTLRLWLANEYLPYGIHDIWGHQTDIRVWQLQLMLAETEGEEWFSRRNHLIRGQRNDLLAIYHGIPCVRIEIQLMYKAHHRLPKDETDFQTSLPLLSTQAKHWLKEQLMLLYPDGHPWLAQL